MGRQDREIRRVLLVTPRLLDTRGGRACTDLALRLDRTRFEPAVCCYAGWGPLARELEEARIEIFPLRRHAGLDPLFPWALAREIRRRRIDVVHSLGDAGAYVVGTLAALLAGVPVAVATFRDRPGAARSPFLSQVGRLCGEVVHRVVATSEEVRDGLFRQRWVPPGKTIVIPDGVNLGRFRAEDSAGGWRERWGVPGDAPLVGAVLQSGGTRELELLCAAFHRVREREPRAHLLVGGIELGDRGLARDEGLTAVGVFGDEAALYAAIDVLCVPFLSRVVPLTLLEGLATGVPIAASLREGEQGLPPAGPWAFANITRPGPDSLADGILELMREPQDARTLARAGRSCIERDHSIEDAVRHIQGLYG